jgi:hypothetical protein
VKRKIWAFLSRAVVIIGTSIFLAIACWFVLMILLLWTPVCLTYAILFGWRHDGRRPSHPAV